MFCVQCEPLSKLGQETESHAHCTHGDTLARKSPAEVSLWLDPFVVSVPEKCLPPVLSLLTAEPLVGMSLQEEAIKTLHDPGQGAASLCFTPLTGIHLNNNNDDGDKYI